MALRLNPLTIATSILPLLSSIIALVALNPQRTSAQGALEFTGPPLDEPLNLSSFITIEWTSASGSNDDPADDPNNADIVFDLWFHFDGIGYGLATNLSLVGESFNITTAAEPSPPGSFVWNASSTRGNMERSTYAIRDDREYYFEARQQPSGWQVESEMYEVTGIEFREAEGQSHAAKTLSGKLTGVVGVMLVAAAGAWCSSL